MPSEQMPESPVVARVMRGSPGQRGYRHMVMHHDEQPRVCYDPETGRLAIVVAVLSQTDPKTPFQGVAINMDPEIARRLGETLIQPPVNLVGWDDQP